MISFLGDVSSTDARVVVLPVPFEATTSYGTGTAQGPQAILQASAHVELYDEELQCDPSRMGIATADAVDCADLVGEAMVTCVAQHVAQIASRGQWPLVLGGEHAITTGCVRGCLDGVPDLGVVQIDAHGDLRDTYEGTPWSHACVMRRIMELGCPTVGVGLRAICEEEAQLIAAQQLPRWFAHDMVARNDWMDAAIAACPPRVFLTLDIDGLDPTLVRATGTPEPGGLQWHPLLAFLRRLFAEREVVGADIVELAPQAGDHASDFITARLAYKMIGYLSVGKH
jgi:agmatinase